MEELKCPECRMDVTDVEKAKDGPDAPPLPENNVGDGAVADVLSSPEVGPSGGEGGATDAPANGEGGSLGGADAPANDESGSFALVPLAGSSTVPAPAGGAMQGFAIEAFKAWNHGAETVVCNECTEVCVMVKARLMSKTLGKFRCDKCNTTHSQIYTGFGKGFEKRLAVISEERRVDFFKNCRGASLKKVTEVCNHLLEEYNIAEKHYAYGGLFKPKSVWENLGYDGHILETMSLPENIIPDRMWGKLYRIPEIGIWEKGTQGKRSAEELGSESNPRAHRLRALPEVPERTEAEPTPEAEAEPEAAKADDSSSSDSSSSSSSSDSSSSPDQPLSKKDKKKKKAARKERAKRKAARKAEKREAKRAKKAAEQQKLEEKEALKAAKQAEKDKAKAEKDAERFAKKAALDEQKAADKAASLLKTTAKASSGKLDKAIANAEKSMRAPGANLVSAAQAEQLKTALESMRQEKAFCDNLVGGLPVPSRWEVPDAQAVKKITDIVKKYEGVYGLHVKAALQTASLAGRDV